MLVDQILICTVETLLNVRLEPYIFTFYSDH